MNIAKSIIEKRGGLFGPASRIRINKDNISEWATFQKLLEDGNIKFDNKGELRYLHGAPAGKMRLTRREDDGTPVYQESTDEWFDQDSQTGREFKWPE